MPQDPASHDRTIGVSNPWMDIGEMRIQQGRAGQSGMSWADRLGFDICRGSTCMIPGIKDRPSVWMGVIFRDMYVIQSTLLLSSMGLILYQSNNMY